MRGLDGRVPRRESFAQRLRQLRIDAGLSQRDLELRSGIPKSRISRYENGHLLPSISGLTRLAKSLDVPDSALLGETEEVYATFVRALRQRGISFSNAEHAQQTAHLIADVLEARTSPARRASRSRSR